jgi:hypothetical protein
MQGDRSPFLFIRREFFPIGLLELVIFCDDFFYERIPFITGWTLACPFCTFISTAAAKKSCFNFAHPVKLAAYGSLIWKFENHPREKSEG